MSRTLRIVLVCLLLLELLLPVQAQKSDTADDLLQHVPMASVVVLKAVGAENGHSWIETLGACAATYAVGAAVTYGLKHTVSEWRPDDTDTRSFPSGHSMFAFAGANTLRHEYGHLSPWVSIGGYGLAAFVAADRIRQDRHFTHDVLAGAAIGTLSSELCYYLKSKLIKQPNVDLTFTGTHLYFAYRF